MGDFAVFSQETSACDTPQGRVNTMQQYLNPNLRTHIEILCAVALPERRTLPTRNYVLVASA